MVKYSMVKQYYWNCANVVTYLIKTKMHKLFFSYLNFLRGVKNTLLKKDPFILTKQTIFLNLSVLLQIYESRLILFYFLLFVLQSFLFLVCMFYAMSQQEFDRVQTSCGVPQGSILKTVVFTINVLSQSLHPNTIFFADFQP